MTGGTGFLGFSLTQRLTGHGHQVTILSRSPKSGHTFPDGASLLYGNPTLSGSWQSSVAEHEVVINLAGSSIFQRWNKKAKQEILDSRVFSTRNIIDALGQRKGEKTLLINASAVGYYGLRGDEILDESSAPGNDFLATVVLQWEKVAQKAKEFGTRVVLCRFGIILGRKQGALAPLKKAFEYNLGSPFGTGKQWFSWIHQQDLADIILFLLKNDELEGPLNCASPNPVRNEELTRTLSEVLEKSVVLPRVPSFILKLLMGEFAETLLSGQRVLPKKLLASGFQHKFPGLKQALTNLLVA